MFLKESDSCYGIMTKSETYVSFKKVFQFPSIFPRGCDLIFSGTLPADQFEFSIFHSIFRHHLLFTDEEIIT